MKIPRPVMLVVWVTVIKKAGDSGWRRFRQSFPLHLAFFFIFLIGLFLFTAGRERVVRAATLSERLGAVSQLCDFEIQKPQNSLMGYGEAFDDETAACSGAFANDKNLWQVTAFQPTSLAYLEAVRLEVRFYITGMGNDRIELELYDGRQWEVLQAYGISKRSPPAELETLEFDVSRYLDSPEKINQASIRFIGEKMVGQADVMTIVLDGARLVVDGAIEPTATPTSTNPPPATPTVRVTLTDLPTATPTVTPTPLPGTIAPILSLTPTPLGLSPTPAASPLPPGSENLQFLWGVEQMCDYAITDSEMALDQQFNDQAASCSGEIVTDTDFWRYIAFQTTNIGQVRNALLEARFSVTGLVNDTLNLEISDGQQWHVLQRFDGKNNGPPGELTTVAYDVSTYLNSQKKINLMSVRLVGEQGLTQGDVITVTLDEIRLVVTGATEATATPTATEMPLFTPSPTSSSPLLQATPTATYMPLPTNLPLPTSMLPPQGRLLALPTPILQMIAAVAPRVAGDPHGDLSGMADGCSGCHSSHAAGGIELRPSWPEESVCYSCHAGAGNGTVIESAFSSYSNTTTGFFKHDVGLTNGVHRLDEAIGAYFGGENRHIECEDCHEPHYAARGESTPPMLQAEMTGISGVDPVWAGPGAPVAFTSLAEADREYQVCFKCHSSFTTLPGYLPDGWNGNAYVANGLHKLTSSAPEQVPDPRDLAQAFNPNQASFHPVVTLGRNQNIPANTFVNGWSQSSMVYCTDCHDNTNASTQGNGPHGSPRLHILKGQANYSTVYQSNTPRVSAQEVCFLCHSYQVYVSGGSGSNFNEHRRHLNEDWGTTCYTCHNSHGSEQQHLINFDASVVTFLNGGNSQTAWYPAAGNGRAGCNLICHGDTHNPETYGPGG